MHMADALLSPAVGGTLWAASAGAIAYCSARLGREPDDRKVPLMGVLGAFLFAAQMINFAIPATGSSGHLGGGLLLAILLGPCAAFVTIASVLVVQALFFADGGLLALGCNIFNMGFFPAFVVFPFFYKRLIGDDPSRFRLTAVAMISALIGVQLGSLAVVLETVCSGVSSLPFSSFVLLMQPIHLAIGLVEGAVTVAIVAFVAKARPELLQGALNASRTRSYPAGTLLLGLLAFAIITAGFFSSFASKAPDGLEWAIAKVAGKPEIEAQKQGVHGTLAELQEKSARFSGYGFGTPAETGTAAKPVVKSQKEIINVSTSVAGIIGTLMTLVLAFLTGLLLKKRNRGAC